MIIQSGNWLIGNTMTIDDHGLLQVIYLRKNVEHLRFAKRRLEEKVQDPADVADFGKPSMTLLKP